VLDKDAVGAGWRDGYVADDPYCLLGVPAEEFRGVRHFAAGVGKRLAVFEGDKAGELFPAFGHQLEAAAEDFGAAAGRRGRPFGEGGRGGVNGGEAVLDVGVGDRCDDGGVGGVDDVDSSAACGVPPVPRDEQLAGDGQSFEIERFLGGKESQG
jgi:hypothetical protein